MVLAIACLRMNSTGSALVAAALAAWMLRLMHEEEEAASRADRTSESGVKAMISTNPQTPMSAEGEGGAQWEGAADLGALLLSTRGRQGSQIRSRASVEKERAQLSEEFFGSE